MSPSLTPSRPASPRKPLAALSPEADRLAGIANEFIAQAKTRLAEHHPANMILLRGFSQHPQLPTMSEIYKLKPVAIAIYPMYRGLARLVGMEVVEAGTTLEDEFATLKQNYARYDFFFLHVKWTDSAGEDGDFDRKVRILEQIDAALPGLVSLEPMSWWLPATTQRRRCSEVIAGIRCRSLSIPNIAALTEYKKFSESAFLSGGLGRLPATQIMPLAMANALKLTKFGA